MNKIDAILNNNTPKSSYIQKSRRVVFASLITSKLILTTDRNFY